MTVGQEIVRKFADYPAFSYHDVLTYLHGRHATKQLSRTISYLKSRGRIFTLRKGVYTVREDSAVSGFGFSPFYYGLLYALTIRELWTQNAEPEIITLKKVRRSRITLFGRKDMHASLHHSQPKHFFGFEILSHGGMKVPVSDPEKTLIDLFYYNIRLPIQSYGPLLLLVNKKKVMSYLERYDNHTRMTVINFITKYKPVAKSLESPY
jgi:predicted transcriptional regulator of viral defense system